MDMQAAATLAPMKDARPALPVSEHSLWDRAAQKRDEIANIIEAELGKQNLVGWVRRSKPGEYPLYVAVDSWLPLNETEISKTFDRSFLNLDLRRSLSRASADLPGRARPPRQEADRPVARVLG